MLNEFEYDQLRSLVGRQKLSTVLRALGAICTTEGVVRTGRRVKPSGAAWKRAARLVHSAAFHSYKEVG